MWKYNGKILRVGRGFTTVEGIQYPSNWATSLSNQDKNDLGITWEESAQSLPYDSRFYWGRDDQGNLIPKNLEDEVQLDENDQPILDDNGKVVTTLGLKSTTKEQVKVTAKSLLEPSDWELIREMDTGLKADPLTKIYRKFIRDKADEIIVSIDNCSTLEELIQLYQPTLDENGEVIDTAVISNWPVKEEISMSSVAIDRITKLQCKNQAVVEGLWDNLKAAIDSDAEIKENWDLASELNISDPAVQAMGIVMSKTSDELQDFFNAAYLL